MNGRGIERDCPTPMIASCSRICEAISEEHGDWCLRLLCERAQRGRYDGEVRGAVSVAVSPGKVRHHARQNVGTDARTRLDVYRLLRAVATDELARGFAVLRENPLSRGVTEKAVESLPHLFGAATRPGTVMVVRAAGPLEAGNTIAASLVELTRDLLGALW